MPSDEMSQQRAGAGVGTGTVPLRARGFIARRIGEGLILGGCFALGLIALNLDTWLPAGGYVVPILAACGAGVALTRARVALWVFDGALLLGILMIAYT